MSDTSRPVYRNAATGEAVELAEFLPDSQDIDDDGNLSPEWYSVPTALADLLDDEEPEE